MAADLPAGDHFPSIYSSNHSKIVKSEPDTPPPTVRDFIREERLKLAKPGLIWSKHRESMEGRSLMYKKKFIDNLMAASKKFSDTLDTAGIAVHYDTIIAFYRKLKEKVKESKDKKAIFEIRRKESFVETPFIRRECDSPFRMMKTEVNSHNMSPKNSNSKETSVFPGRANLTRRTTKKKSTLNPVVLGSTGIMSPELRETAKNVDHSNRRTSFTMQVRLAMRLIPVHDDISENNRSSVFGRSRGKRKSKSLTVESSDLKKMKDKVAMRKLREDASLVEKRQNQSLFKDSKIEEKARSISIKRIQEIRPKNVKADIIGRLGLSPQEVRGFDKSDLYSFEYTVKEKIREQIKAAERKPASKPTSYCERNTKFRKRRAIGKNLQAVRESKLINTKPEVQDSSFQSSNTEYSATEKRLGECYRNLALGCPLSMVKPTIQSCIKRKLC